MPLEDVDISIDFLVLPDDVVAFLREADLRVSQFVTDSPRVSFLRSFPMQRQQLSKQTCSLGTRYECKRRSGLPSSIEKTFDRVVPVFLNAAISPKLSQLFSRQKWLSS